MKTKRIFYLIAIILSGIMLNTNMKAQSAKLPFTGAEFQYLKQGTGQKGNIGDFVQFSFFVTDQNGNMLADRRDSINWGMDKIMAPDSNTIPLAEMIHSMKVGDSTLFKMVLTPEQKGPGMEQIDSVFYYFKLENIIDEATMQAKQAEQAEKMAKKMEEGKKNEEKVAANVAELLRKYHAAELKNSILKTDSGLEYYIIEKANGKPVNANEMVAVDYYGALMSDGKFFDSSFGRGEKLRFTAGAGQMIKGWDEAMLLLGHGDKAILFIPYTLAYGEEGRPPTIPQKAGLAFYIEIE